MKGASAVSNEDGWICTGCGRRFARRGQRHVCERWTVEQHLTDASPGAQAIYRRLVEGLEASGPFEFEPVRSQIGFRGPNRIFAGVHFSRDRVRGYLDLPRRVETDRFRVEEYTKRLWVHHFTLTSPDDVDDEFTGWLREAYEVGQGTHLKPR